MKDVIQDYDERVSQIEKYLLFTWVMGKKSELSDLGDISNSRLILGEESEICLKEYLTNCNEFVIESELIKILKSNTILLLYNLVEGLINSVMNEFINSINKDRCKFSELENPVKKIWLRYKHKSFGTNTTKSEDYVLGALESIIEEIIEIKPKKIKDSEFGGVKTVYNFDAFSLETNANGISGNLDARSIRELFNLYGLPQITKSCDSLLKVKNKRNSLAHGSETFAKVGADFTIEDLYKMKIEICLFLQLLLGEIDLYLADKRFKIGSKL
jgi:hypothetical protein